LVKLKDRIHGSVLPDDPRAQECFDFFGGLAVTRGIEWLVRSLLEEDSTARTGLAGHSKPLLLILASFSHGNRDGGHRTS
jgi:hypothetical protein